MQQCFDQTRKNMIDGQIKPHRVTNEILIEALRNTPREQFLPARLQSRAYVDEDINLGHGRFMPEPMILARLIQEAGVRKTDTVLDIGCGTGYSSAILACLASNIIGIEQDKRMATEAGLILKRLDIRNVDILQQEDMRQGYAGKAPYNVILINNAVEIIPDKIKSQLADGGRLVTIALSGDRYAGHLGSAVLVTRQGDSFITRKIFDAATPVLPGFEAPKEFVF